VVELCQGLLPTTPDFMITFDQTMGSFFCYFYLGHSPMQRSIEAPPLPSFTCK
jgi:hypothetical protein